MRTHKGKYSNPPLVSQPCVPINAYFLECIGVEVLGNRWNLPMNFRLLARFPIALAVQLTLSAWLRQTSVSPYAMAHSEFSPRPRALISHVKLPFFFPRHLITAFSLDYITGEKSSEWIVSPGKLTD